MWNLKFFTVAHEEWQPCCLSEIITWPLAYIYILFVFLNIYDTYKGVYVFSFFLFFFFLCIHVYYPQPFVFCFCFVFLFVCFVFEVSFLKSPTLFCVPVCKCFSGGGGEEGHTTEINMMVVVVVVVVGRWRWTLCWATWCHRLLFPSPKQFRKISKAGWWLSGSLNDR